MALPEPCRARFHDGRSAAEHPVRIALSEDRFALEITGDSLPAPLRWPLPDLRALRDGSDATHLVLTRHAETADESPRDPARLVVDDPEMVAWLRRTRPDLTRTDLREGTAKRIALTASAALVAVILMLFVILPSMANTLAGLIPMQREVALGRAVTGQVERMLGGTEPGALQCDGADGRAALEALTARLTRDAALDYALDVRVFDHEMVNALAAPGGQVVLLRGLLEDASGPDAVAGVLAHEIGHVASRDPTRAALRSVGSAGLLSLILGDVTGGALVALLGEQMLNSSYTREAERAADGDRKSVV